jgi:hypothetical protein
MEVCRSTACKISRKTTQIDLQTLGDFSWGLLWNSPSRLLLLRTQSRKLGIHYSNTGKSIPEIYSDATWTSDPESKLDSVSLSTTESEWFALSETTKECIYLKHAMSQLRFTGIQHWISKPMIIWKDNQAVIKIAVSCEPKYKH